MPVTRIHKSKDYTIMSNHHFKDKSLSLKSKGLLSLMLSLPENWDYSIEGLATLSSDGSTAVKTALQELEKHDYLYRRRIYKNGKIADIEYHIFENPKDCVLHRENLNVENLNVENLHEENLNVENSDNKILKNKNTKEIKSNNKLFDTNEDKSTSDSEKIVKLYHQICVSLPKVRSLTDKRKKAIQSLFKKGYMIGHFTEVFTRAQNSDFLTGKNDRGWKADLDFLLREDKFVKTMEGGYSSSNDSKSKDGLIGNDGKSKERKDELKRRIENGEHIKEY